MMLIFAFVTIIFKASVVTHSFDHICMEMAHDKFFNYFIIILFQYILQDL